MSVDVLVLRALGMGDLLTAVPALRGVRRAFPDARITLAAPEWLAELVAEVEAVDALSPTPGLVPLVWSGRPQVAVNLHGRGPLSTDLLRRLEPEFLITHDDGFPWRDDLHEVVRWCHLLARYGIDADPADLRLPLPDDAGPAPGAVVVHPGASHAARRWPSERYAAVVRALEERGERVVVTGSAAERPLAEPLGGQVLAGELGLRSLAALVANAKLLICGDTGVAHLATAYRTPSVLLFGPVSPALWGPSDRVRHQVLWSGRTGDTFADRPDPGLLDIGVEDVLEAVECAPGRPDHH